MHKSAFRFLMNKIGCPLYKTKGFPYFIFSHPIIMTWRGDMPLIRNRRALVIWVGQGFENESVEVFFCILLIKNVMKDKRTRASTKNKNLEVESYFKALRNSRIMLCGYSYVVVDYLE